MAVKTELQTRRDLIDPALKKASWDAQDRTRVVSEVDTETVERLRGYCEERLGVGERRVGSEQALVKCPRCGNSVTARPTKKWQYSGMTVKHFRCGSCQKNFNVYVRRDGTEYTIPKSR